jgi:NADPH:quinone reductase-like Zn-dependent oxidoreductase
MQAIVCNRYGGPDVLRLVEIATPLPAENEVLLRVRAASVNALDWRLMRGKPLIARLMAGGMRRPRHAGVGRDVAGEVVSVGAGVSRFIQGDAVFGACIGAFAEYACAKIDRLVLKPPHVSFESAAAVPIAGITALQALCGSGRVKAGQRILIDGASGGVGTFALQIAKALGAHVTAVCSSANVDAARAMGADRVVDYTREDFLHDGQRYDLVIGANAHRSIFDYRRALHEDGTYVMAGGGGAQILQGLLLAPLLSLAGRRKLRFIGAKLDTATLHVLQEMLAAGQIVPAIERRYALHETAEAVRHVEAGHARGKTVIVMP